MNRISTVSAFFAPPRAENRKKPTLQTLPAEVLVPIYNYAFDTLEPKDQLRPAWTMKFFREEALLRAVEAEVKLREHQQHLREMAPGPKQRVEAKKPLIWVKYTKSAFVSRNCELPQITLQKGV